MEKIILRRATPADAPKILHITRDAFEKYAAEVRRREKIAALYETELDVINDIHDINVFVCEVDGDIQGCVRVRIMEEGIAYLSRFAVTPEASSLGLGGLLLEKVKLECIAMGARAIVLHTASRMRSTVSFYLKNGYYIHSISKDSDYIRAVMVNELFPMDELFDYESIVDKLKSHK